MIWFLLLLFAAPVAASAQAAAGGVASPPPQSPPGLALAEPVWRDINVTFTSGNGIVPPLVGTRASRSVHPTVDHNRPANRARYTSGMTPQGSTTRTFGGPFREASVAVTNTGAHTLESARLDFVFTDPATRVEVLRISHRSKKRLRPGRSYVYKKTVRSSHRTRPADGALLSVEIKEVIYADGSAWRPDGGS